MSKVEFARDRLRSRLLNLIDEYEAMLVLLAEMDVSIKKRLELERATTAKANKRQLQLGISRLSARINKIRRQTEATQPIGFYSRFFNIQLTAEPIKDGLIMSQPVYVSLLLFSNYPNIAKQVENDEIPLHATIELDYGGRYERPDSRRLHILEASLFEDMCFFWNESCVISPTGKPYSQKRELKRLAALHRAAISSAFYMVEAFCNGIALEAYLEHRDELNDRERQLLTERDSKQDRPRYVKIRDKLLQYPRLLLRASEPPVQESNCPQLAYFLGSAREFRDSIVHANPAPDYETLAPNKSQTFMRLDHAQCAEIIDCSIAVVEQIASAIKRRKSVFWLQHRLPNGLFDQSVFD